ncbi:MAG: sigma-54-dependent transcriptional regulator [Bacteroidales bacterium]
MEPFRIFIVEDNSFYGAMLKHFLEKNPANKVYHFSKGVDCLKHMHLNPSLISLDYSLPDMLGIDVLKRIKSIDIFTPVIMISGQEKISTAINVLKAGACDYFEKDEDVKQRLWEVVENIKQNKKDTSINYNKYYSEKDIIKNFRKDIKGKSTCLKRVFELMKKATETNISISIQGETGTGKELVAKAIHRNSNRQNRSFVAINLSATPSSLMESELFGHEKGAFTGADKRRIGKLEEANKGTLFLDEITEIPPNIQVKLLRVLQEKEFHRIGSNKIIKTNFRLIIASNKNLIEEVKNGNFRKDLYYRLLGLPIFLPPLRDRRNDISLLAKYFCSEFCKENQKPIKTLSHQALEKLSSYKFPGNIRELKAIVDLSVVLSDNNIIDSKDISFTETPDFLEKHEEEMPLASYQKKIIRYYLDKYNQNVLLVSKKLQIGKSTLYRMLKNEQV